MGSLPGCQLPHELFVASLKKPTISRVIERRYTVISNRRVLQTSETSISRGRSFINSPSFPQSALGGPRQRLGFCARQKSAAHQRGQAGQRLAVEKEMEEGETLRCPWGKPNAKSRRAWATWTPPMSGSLRKSRRNDVTLKSVKSQVAIDPMSGVAIDPIFRSRLASSGRN